MNDRQLAVRTVWSNHMIRTIRALKALTAAGALALSGLGVTSAQAANLLTNGGFEGGPANNFAAGYYRGPLAPEGWSRLAGFDAPDILSNSYVQTGAGFASLLGAQEGVRFIDANSARPTGGLFQDVIGLSAGTQVTLTYYVGRWAQNSSGTLVASLLDPTNLSLLGQQTATLAHLPQATSATWELYTLQAFVPASGKVRVQFTGNSGSTSRGAPGLDNVSLKQAPTAAVPEPTTWALMIGGFGAVGAMLRRRRYATTAA